MPKMDWGHSAINHEVSMPGHTVQPMGVMTAGPTFDLTPHDAYTTPIMNPEKVPAMDVLPSPYGPPYGAEPVTGRLSDALSHMKKG